MRKAITAALAAATIFGGVVSVSAAGQAAHIRVAAAATQSTGTTAWD